MLKGLVILDGPDATGKTTLARRFCELYNAHYIHLTRRWVNNMFEYNTAALHHAIGLAEHQLVVIDRLWMSELVYSEAFHGGTKYPHMGRLIHRVVQKHAGIYIMCLDSDINVNRKRFSTMQGKRQEMYASNDMVHMYFNDLYHGIKDCGLDEMDREYFPGRDYMSDIVMGGGLKSWPMVVRYELEKDGQDMPKFCENIVQRVIKRRADQIVYALGAHNHNFSGYAYEAKHLMIGDRLSTTKYRKIGWPFHFYSNSSLFLAESMSRMGLNENDFCWTNINERLGDELVVLATKEILDLNPITLGKEAEQRYCSIAWHLPFHRFISHPQWYRRFHTNDRLMELDIRKALAYFSGFGPGVKRA